MNLKADPARAENHEATGIYIRATNAIGKWVSVDIAELDRESLFRFLRSRGGANLWAENTVMVLLGHAGVTDDEATRLSESEKERDEPVA